MASISDSSAAKRLPNVDGLRGIAALLVVTYHLFPNFAPGGFIGVDIFFVISGFLITYLIIYEQESDEFSILNFYGKRILRIVPALSIILVFVAIAGWFILFASEYSVLGRHILGGSTFISNILLQKEAGYFDASAIRKPLLHLWSLGVEEQFYLIWPLLLFVSYKRLNQIIIILGLFFISFSLNVIYSHINTTKDFYSTQSRLWEFMIGAFCVGFLPSTLALKSLHSSFTKIYNSYFDFALVHSPNTEIFVRSRTAIGLALIGLTMCMVHGTNNFPGLFAVPVTIGTGLILTDNCKNKYISCSNKILIWFGSISFPLYLWHWPLLVFTKLLYGDQLSFYCLSILYLLTIGLAWVTYAFVERPVRSVFKRSKAVTLVVMLTVIAAYGAFTYFNGGFKSRAVALKYEQYFQTMARTERLSECFDIPLAHQKPDHWYCKLGHNTDIDTFFYGDSHALSYLPVFDTVANFSNKSVAFAGNSGCPPLLTDRLIRESDQQSCSKLNQRIFEFVKSNGIKRVILIARWTYYPADFLDNGLKQTIESYRAIGVEVVIFEDNPFQTVDPSIALRLSQLTDESINKFSVSRGEHLIKQEAVNAILDKTRDKIQKIVRPDTILCDESHCPLTLNGRFLYFDQDHLSTNGARLLAPLVTKALN